MNRPEYIIIHHSLTKDSGTVSWQAIRRYHMQMLGWRDIGYHYGVERVNGQYEILIGRLPHEPGAHCRGYNSRSLGVCVVGNFDLAPPSPEQFAAAGRLVRGLMNCYKVPVQNVVGHRRFSRKSCPGSNWDMGAFRSMIL